jgi:Mn2+/Fe2+ NRAMP family transporter
LSDCANVVFARGGSSLVGAALNFTSLDPVKALIWSAIVSGVAAVPIMARIMLMASRKAPRQLARIQLDTLVGMGISNIIALFIMITTAATLNAHGVTDIQTSSQAAEALRPIAGRFAFTVFALGIVGTGMLALPVRLPSITTPTLTYVGAESRSENSYSTVSAGEGQWSILSAQNS